MTKKKTKITAVVVSLCLAVISALTFCLTHYLNADATTSQAALRTMDVTQNKIDYQKVFDEFDDGVLKTEGNLTTFEGTKSISLKDLEEIDNLSESDVESLETLDVRYYFSYDSVQNIVSMTAETKNGENVLELETVYGAAFIDDNGDIDAVLNVDGELLLLSELSDKGMIENCGWFSKVLKKVAVAVVATVAVAAVTAVVVATCGAGLGACIAAGAIAGGITGGIAGGVISYQETGEVKWEWIVIGATAGAAIGAATGWVVGSACGATTVVPKYGDSFGKYGTYIKNPKIKVDWTKTTAHGAQRMQERYMTQSLVNKVVSSGKAFSQNSGSKYLFLSKDGAAVLSKSGELITTYSSSNFTDDVIALLKLLGVL